MYFQSYPCKDDEGEFEKSTLALHVHDLQKSLRHSEQTKADVESKLKKVEQDILHVRSECERQVDVFLGKDRECEQLTKGMYDGMHACFGSLFPLCASYDGP
jgi:hypothetical protein